MKQLQVWDFMFCETGLSGLFQCVPGLQNQGQIEVTSSLGNGVSSDFTCASEHTHDQRPRFCHLSQEGSCYCVCCALRKHEAPYMLSIIIINRARDA